MLLLEVGKMDGGDFGILPFSFTASGPFNVFCTEGPGVEAVP